VRPDSLLRDLLKVGLFACLAIGIVAGYATVSDVPAEL